MATFSTDFVAETDLPEWRVIFEGYAAFYGVALTEEVAGRVWRWLRDPDHVLEGLLARDVHGRAVGLAHVRGGPRALDGCDIGFVDDMFVLPEARGHGVAEALTQGIQVLAAERGWPTIRWLTQHFKERGRRFYDWYTGGPGDFVVYQWPEI